MTGLGQLGAGPVGSAKKYWSGTHRIVSPEETLDAVRRFFPVLGITRVADISGLDDIGIPVVSVCRPNSRSVVVSLGKALDLAGARASGVMESIEAFMAERIIQPLILGSFNDLQFSHRLVDVDALPRTASSRYHPDFPILWIEGDELLSGGRVWVPYETVHTAYTLPAPTGTGCFTATSNGLASGNHLLEAISHGISETVERDAAALHGLSPAAEVARRRINPDTVDDAGCRAALGRIGRAGLRAGIWDMTTDIGIPAFRCELAETAAARVRVGRAFEGMGCHPDRGVALLRALTEAVQSRVATIAGVRDEPGQWDCPALAEDPPPDPSPAVRPDEAPGDFTAVTGLAADSIDADLAWELDALRAAGLGEVVVVDLTREEFGIPVVRVVIPGLEGPAGIVSGCRPGRRALDLAGVR